MKLLQKTIRNYFAYSVLLLLIATPAFYFVIQSIVEEDVDESLVTTKAIIYPRLVNALATDSGRISFLDHDIHVYPSTSMREYDSLVTLDVYDSVAKEIVPQRILTSNLLINGRPYRLVIKNSMVDRNDLIESIVFVQAILMLLLLAGLFLINRSLSKRIWKPFYETLKKLREYNVESSAALAISLSTVDEFNDLKRALEELTNRTRQTFLEQKEFTENASHEMQTPLAIFQSKLELLMQTHPLNEEQAQLIGDMADASQRMARLNKSLVLLTRIENRQYPDVETISLKNVVNDTIRQYQDYSLQKQLDVQADMEEGSIVANKTLLEILAGNLIGNAIRHNLINGFVKIILTPGELTIQNSGRPVSLAHKNLFRRFQKDSSDTHSLGLGLEIVHKICQLYQYTVVYRYQEGIHAFTIKFIP